MRSLNSDLKRSKREATDLMGVTKSLREDLDRSTGLLPKSGPEQLSMQSSMVSKLLALPENGNFFCFRTTQIGMIDKKCTCATTEDEKLANALFVIEVEPSKFGLAIALAEG